MTGAVLGMVSPGTGQMLYPAWHLGLGVLTVVILDLTQLRLVAAVAGALVWPLADFGVQLALR